MAKPKTSSVKPLTSRPLDLLYYVFFVIHLLITIFIDLLPLWPTVLRELPITKQLFGVLKGVADDYVKQTNDPFALVMWGLVDREWEFMYAKVFMWMEVFIQLPSFIIGIIGLRRNTPYIYPALLAYSSAALVTTVTYMIVVYTAPSIHDEALNPISRPYAMTEEGRGTILKATAGFLIVPAIMWIDMMFRLGGIVKASIRSGAASKGGKAL